MVTQMPDQEQFVDLTFPERGVNLTQGYGSALPGTTPLGENVRWVEPLENRGRGGSRPGLVKLTEMRPQDAQ